jgi:hypothetical protein
VAGLDAGRARARPGQPTRPSFTAINGAFVSQLNAQDAGDMAPTAATLAAYAATCRELAVVVASWERFTSRDFIDFNTMLQTRGRAALPRPSAVLRAPSCP